MLSGVVTRVGHVKHYLILGSLRMFGYDGIQDQDVGEPHEFLNVNLHFWQIASISASLKLMLWQFGINYFLNEKLTARNAG